MTRNFGDCVRRRAHFLNIVGDYFLWSRLVLDALRTHQNQQRR